MSGALAWVFDLDNTLHDANPHIFPHINRAMTRYVQEQLALDEAAASALRQHYWRRYGATILGLMRYHGTDPHHFLWHTHQFPDLPRMLVHEPQLRHVLRRLPGRKVVFSNSPLHYALAVLRALGIDLLFDGVFAIEHARIRPKPDAYGFYRLLRRHGFKPACTAMVEDDLENLRTAKRLGMKTVWVSDELRLPDYVDVRVGSLAELPRAMLKL
ncbi:MAG: pyrimidine 5'-nucleotidase [Pseudomonadota bacterium]